MANEAALVGLRLSVPVSGDSAGQLQFETGALFRLVHSEDGTNGS
jgi:hypothetical protein